MINLCDYLVGQTVYVPWSTNAADGSSVTRATDGSIRIYKNASLTQRSSGAGITDSEDFDSITGTHLLAVDLSDNTDAGFYAAGNDYHVMLVAATIDGLTVNRWLATFSIQNRPMTKALVEPTAAPAATAVPRDVLAWLLALSANPLIQGAANPSPQTLRNRADSTDIADATITHTSGVDTVRSAFS